MCGPHSCYLWKAERELLQKHLFADIYLQGQHRNMKNQCLYRQAEQFCGYSAQHVSVSFQLYHFCRYAISFYHIAAHFSVCAFHYLDILLLCLYAIHYLNMICVVHNIAVLEDLAWWRISSLRVSKFVMSSTRTKCSLWSINTTRSRCHRPRFCY